MIDSNCDLRKSDILVIKASCGFPGSNSSFDNAICLFNRALSPRMARPTVNDANTYALLDVKDSAFKFAAIVLLKDIRRAKTDEIVI